MNSDSITNSYITFAIIFKTSVNEFSIGLIMNKEILNSSFFKYKFQHFLNQATYIKWTFGFNDWLDME